MFKAAIKQVMARDMADIWSVLTPAQRRRIIDNFAIHKFRKNHTVYAERSMPQYLWTLLEGSVKKYKVGVGGRGQILRLIKPVQYFGYRAYFAAEPYGSSAVTLEPSTLGTLPMTVVEEMIRNNTRVAMFFIHELSRNLGSSDTKIVNLAQKHLRGRLAEALAALLDNYGYESDQMTLAIYMSREDLANLSNMTTANAIRTLSGFVAEKLLLVDGRKIKIIDEPGLRHVSKFG